MIMFVRLLQAHHLQWAKLWATRMGVKHSQTNLHLNYLTKDSEIPKTVYNTLYQTLSNNTI